MTRPFGDAVADIVHRVVTGHVLFLQEERGMRFTLGEYGDEHVRASHFLPPGRLNMESGALHHTLKPVRRLGFLMVFHHQVF